MGVTATIPHEAFDTACFCLGVLYDTCLWLLYAVSVYAVRRRRQIQFEIYKGSVVEKENQQTLRMAEYYSGDHFILRNGLFEHTGHPCDLTVLYQIDRRKVILAE